MNNWWKPVPVIQIWSHTTDYNEGRRLIQRCQADTTSGYAIRENPSTGPLRERSIFEYKWPCNNSNIHSFSNQSAGNTHSFKLVKTIWEKKICLFHLSCLTWFKLCCCRRSCSRWPFIQRKPKMLFPSEQIWNWHSKSGDAKIRNPV